MSKPKLQAKVKTSFFVDADDFNKFVEECYGGSFEFMAIQEANFNVEYEFTAPNMHMDFEGKNEKKIREEGKYPMWCTHLLFNMLHKDGFIPAGTYFLKCDH